MPSSKKVRVLVGEREIRIDIPKSEPDWKRKLRIEVTNTAAIASDGLYTLAQRPRDRDVYEAFHRDHGEQFANTARRIMESKLHRNSRVSFARDCGQRLFFHPNLPMPNQQERKLLTEEFVSQLQKSGLKRWG